MIVVAEGQREREITLDMCSASRCWTPMRVLGSRQREESQWMGSVYLYLLDP